jgi:hypothetical protein
MMARIKYGAVNNEDPRYRNRGMQGSLREPELSG